jgi:hypothetical protein
MFNHIEAGRFAKQPAGEHPAVPAGPTFADIDLNESTDLLRQFPRRGALAGREADDHRADLAALAGLERNVLREIVALVEQAKRGHAVFHRGCTARLGIGSRRAGGGWSGGIKRDALGLRLTGAVASGEQKRAGSRRCEKPAPHDPAQPSALSGVQAS